MLLISGEWESWRDAKRDTRASVTAAEIGAQYSLIGRHTGRCLRPASVRLPYCREGSVGSCRATPHTSSDTSTTSATAFPWSSDRTTPGPPLFPSRELVSSTAYSQSDY